MIIKFGDKIYKYTVRNGKLFIHEGVVTEYRGRKFVYFEDSSPRTRCPKDEEIGMIRSNGPSLWLLEKNDELARRLFIEFEEKGLSELKKLIERKNELLNMLKTET